MKIIKTIIPDLLIIEPKVFDDKRGYFFESYNESNFTEAGLNYNFIQDNESLSSYGVIRGLHFQIGEFAQAKLVRVIKGRVLDVAVDLRKNSPTYKQWFSVELTEENKLQLLIPRGFAHGFSVLSEQAIFSYKCDNFYNKDSERSINIFDSELAVDWKIEKEKAIISDKDISTPMFENRDFGF